MSTISSLKFRYTKEDFSFSKSSEHTNILKFVLNVATMGEEEWRKEKLTFGHLKQIILSVIEKSPNVYKGISEVKSLWKVEEFAKDNDNDKWKILEETV